MKALRVILTQSSANYRKEEATQNKMTYPLPPYSTVIGAIHVACGYREYKPMDISIQGKYESMILEPYTDYCFLNSLQDDRGILVKLKNSKYMSTAYDKVAKALKTQGNSFRKGTTIHIYNEKLMEEYRYLKDLNDKLDDYNKNELKPKLNEIKIKKKELADRKKENKNNKEILEKIKNVEAELKKEEKDLKDNFEKDKRESYIEPYSKFATLTTSLKYYEVLNNIELVLHIRAEEEILKDIEDNIYNLKSIGRSEDFVDIKEVKIVELVDEIEETVISDYSAYIEAELIREGFVLPKMSDDVNYSGTKYYLNKKYSIINKKRVFEKKKVIYVSEYQAAESTENLLFDIDENTAYIVNFV